MAPRCCHLLGHHRGSADRLRRANLWGFPSRLGIVVMGVIVQMAPLPGGTRSDTLNFALLALPVLVFVFFSYRQALARPVRNLVWVAVVICVCAASWLCMIVVVVVYGKLLGGYPRVAIFLLPLATASWETGLVALVEYLYCRLVFNQRMIGDESRALVFAISVVHSFAETCRLCSLIVGAILTGSFSWVGSCALAFGINLAIRHQWVRVAAAFFLQRCAPRLAPLVAFTLADQIHAQVKTAFGYPRFAYPIALALVRAAHGLSPLHTKSALVCLVACILLEAIEDVIVHAGWLRHVTMPVYFDALDDEFESPFHPRRRTWLSPGEEGEQVRVECFGMQGVRRLSPSLVLAMVACVSFGFPLLLQVLLGVGFVDGVCSEPLPASARQHQVLFWPSPLACN
mmetsp:Transcript_69811/g.160492  ORF Transcript_69811/g.160492 Transcript_69811/m.160492 type:complete len:400 (+) Transcript_69811:490-1689(+)